MLLYEISIAIAIEIAVVLVVAAIDRLAAWVMMGPEEMALLRLARAATAQRRLVASAAQQEREARAAAAQRRLVAYWTHALAAPLPARLATLITQLETQDRGSSYARARAQLRTPGSGSEWSRDVRFDPFATCVRSALSATSGH